MVRGDQEIRSVSR